MVPFDVALTVPPVDEWTHQMENASSEKALEQWQHAQRCLHTLNTLTTEGLDPYRLEWGDRIRIAQKVMRKRGIPFD